VARHRSPGGRGTVSTYLSRPDAGRTQADSGFAASSSESTTIVSAIPQPGGARRSTHRRALAKPTVRGNTVVSATAALGAVVTGGFMAANPMPTHVTADAAEALLPPADLAAATQPLRVQPVSAGTELNNLESVTSPAASLPVAVPGDRVAAVDQRDVEALHKGEKLAAEAAAAHAAAVKEARILAGGGDLDDWISVALNKMGMSQSLASGVKRIIMAESRGNPKAINRTDSNALAGRPSQGLMQVIPSTFRAYVLPELRNRPITDPVANITAGVRYMIANYGVSTLKSGGRSNSAGRYIGY
jgi:hypothetical protein